MNRQNVRLQATLLFFVILGNFLSQIPYFFHLYSRSQPLATTVRSSLILGLVFAFFLIASYTLFEGQRMGYPLMVVFLATEFLFYLWNVLGSTIHGYGLFFQVRNPDLTLRIIYSIGYLNLFASGYFLFLLLFYRGFYQNGLARAKEI